MPPSSPARPCAERLPGLKPCPRAQRDECSLTEVSWLRLVRWQVFPDGCLGPPRDNPEQLENEVMLDPWSSMESSNSPLTDSASGSSADATPSPSGVAAPPHKTETIDCTAQKPPVVQCQATANDVENPKKNLTLELDRPERLRHFLDEDYRPPIPQPHFLDHSASPDELDDRSDITNPNFLDEELADEKPDVRRGALPKKPLPVPPATHIRTQLHYLGAAQSSERDKRASQLYRGTWPADGWPHDTASVRSFSSAGSSSNEQRRSSELETKMDCVYSLFSLLSRSPDSNADLSGPLLELSRSVDNCLAMRQSGCIPLLVQLIHSTQPRDTRNRAAQALRNIIHTQTDDKAGRREARVWRLLEQVREYCYFLEDTAGEEQKEEDMSRHPSQCVAALMKLSFDEEHRHVVCQLGGLQALARLVSADQAAHGTRQEEGACVTMRKYAGMTLTNLTFGDGNNKSLLCSFKDFMLALVEQLQSPNDDMRQVTSAVLRNLSWRADSNSKQVLREVGAVKGLTLAAMTCQKEATLKSVLSALWNLTAHCSMNKVALCSVQGALGFLVDMLSYNSPTKTLAIVENAGGIMRNVSSHIAIREDYRQILRERNCLSVLLQHLKSPSLTVVSNSCGTLWNLSARCPLDQQFLWDQGAVPMLRSLIHSKHKMIAMGSSAALKNLLNSKPGKNHIISLDSTARNMNLPVLPTLGVRKQKALEQEIDQNLAETCDNIEPATSPSTTNRDEKNLFSATERKLAMNLERHRMTSSSPLVGHLGSQTSLSHSANLAGYFSCTNTLLKGTASRSGTGTSQVNRSDSKDSVTSSHSETVSEKATRIVKVPIPTPRTKDINKTDDRDLQPDFVKPFKKNFQPPIPPPRSTIDLARTNYTNSGYDVDNDSCDQPIDYSRKYTEAKSNEPLSGQLAANALKSSKMRDKSKKYPEKDSETFGDYQETDLDQPTDYSIRYAEHQSETSSDISETEPRGLSAHEDTIKLFCTEGTPYETPVVFSTATSISDLRVIGNQKAASGSAIVKSNPEAMTQSDEKDTCSIEEPPRHDNDAVASRKSEEQPQSAKSGHFDTKFSSGMVSPEKPVNYCDEGTPGCFSRDSSLSSIDGELAEETSLAKRNAMANMHIIDDDLSGSAKDKDGSKAVTFACTPEPSRPAEGLSAVADVDAASPARSVGCVEDTPLVFSRCSSPSSLSGCSVANGDDHASVVSEISRLTSGCISPSEIPDSPGQSIPQSPRTRARAAHALRMDRTPPTPPAQGGARSVFEERTAVFLVENTPAHFSTATSLSSLTIDEHQNRHARPSMVEVTQTEPNSLQTQPDPCSPATFPAVLDQRNQQSEIRPLGGDTFRAYCTEDTPALLSKVGSGSELSALSIETSGRIERALTPLRHSSSDSSNLSDTGRNLLNECIQRGIEQTVRSGSRAAESPTAEKQQYVHREQLYRSLPTCLRANAETASCPPRRSTALFRRADTASAEPTAAPLSSDESPPPPLPPKLAPAPPPPRPPAPANSSPPLSGSDDDRIFHQAVQRGMQIKEKRKERSALIVKALPPALARADSLSSLSLDSYGSTDREIFEECVQLGLSGSRAKAHSAERILDAPADRNKRGHKSLDRDKTSRRARVRDPQLERVAKPGKRREGRASRASHDPPQRRECSESLSSLSGDSFGSTDKELFERSVRLGMTKPPETRETRPRVRDARRRADYVSRAPGALDRMTGEEDSRDRALLEEMIARGAGERANEQSKNVLAPSAARAPADGSDALARITCTRKSGSESLKSGAESPKSGAHLPQNRADVPQTGAELPNSSCDLENTTDDSKLSPDTPESTVSIDRSNEYPAVLSADITLESTLSVEHDRSNEYMATLTSDITVESELRDLLDHSNESYADVLDGSSWSVVHSTPKDPRRNVEKCHTGEEVITLNDSATQMKDTAEGSALPDLLEKSALSNLSFPGPDLTDRLRQTRRSPEDVQGVSSLLSLGDDPHSFTSVTIEQEAARLAAKLKNRLDFPSMECSANFDLNSVRPPSNMGSLVSLTNSLSKEESSKQRKKSLPVALMVKRALSNSFTYHNSMEHLDKGAISMLEHVKPPSELEHIDMESSIISVSSIVSEIADKELSIQFDVGQPVSTYSMLLCGPIEDLERVDPPSLLEQMTETTFTLEPTELEFKHLNISTTLQQTDCASVSGNCSPLPCDLSSVETTPKRGKSSRFLTPKEKRNISKERYQTYTISDENNAAVVDVTLHDDFDSDLTLESDTKSEENLTNNHKIKKRLSAKQRRQEDRARYQTQVVDASAVLTGQAEMKSPDPEIEDLKQRLAVKKTLREKRTQDAERYRTRTIEDVPPSPTYVCDVNFENVETTTGYDSLSSNEPTHQQLGDHRSREAELQLDSGTNDDDLELNTAQLQTYTKSFRNYLPVVESPAAVDMCVFKNLKNIEMTALHRRASEHERDSDSEPVTPPVKAKPKIIKPADLSRDNSLDSTGSCEEEHGPKAVRGRRKPVYVSPYKRSLPARKSPIRTVISNGPSKSSVPKPAAKSRVIPKTAMTSRIQNPASKPQVTTPSRLAPKSTAVPKPLPLERQGTFTKEERTTLPKETIKRAPVSKIARPASSKLSANTSANTSPCRLPQRRSAPAKPFARRSLGAEPKEPAKRLERASYPSMKNSPSDQSLQSNDSVKTVTLTSGSGTRAASSVGQHDAVGKIAGLWKRVEQSKRQQRSVPDRRVWIAAEGTSKDTRRLVRSSTFEGKPKREDPVSAPKTKSSIAIRVSQVPVPRCVGRTLPYRSGDVQRKALVRKPVKQEIVT